MEEAKLDLKGVLSFLAITFVVTYAIEGALILSGFRITRLPAAYLPVDRRGSHVGASVGDGTHHQVCYS